MNNYLNPKYPHLISHIHYIHYIHTHTLHTYITYIHYIHTYLAYIQYVCMYVCMYVQRRRTTKMRIESLEMDSGYYYYQYYYYYYYYLQHDDVQLQSECLRTKQEDFLRGNVLLKHLAPNENCLLYFVHLNIHYNNKEKKNLIQHAENKVTHTHTHTHTHTYQGQGDE